MELDLKNYLQAKQNDCLILFLKHLDFNNYYDMLLCNLCDLGIFAKWCDSMEEIIVYANELNIRSTIEQACKEEGIIPELANTLKKNFEIFLDGLIECKIISYLYALTTALQQIDMKTIKDINNEILQDLKLYKEQPSFASLQHLLQTKFNPLEKYGKEIELLYKKHVEIECDDDYKTIYTFKL